MVRKLFNFSDTTIDLQFVEVINGINGVFPGNIFVIDPVTLKKYLLAVDSSSGVPQLALIEQ